MKITTMRRIGVFAALAVMVIAFAGTAQAQNPASCTNGVDITNILSNPYMLAQVQWYGGSSSDLLILHTNTPKNFPCPASAGKLNGQSCVPVTILLYYDFPRGEIPSTRINGNPGVSSCAWQTTLIDSGSQRIRLIPQ